jgi:Glycosyl hydrolase family 12
MGQILSQDGAMSYLSSARLSVILQTFLVAVTGAAMLPLTGWAQTSVTSDSLLNTGNPTSTTYSAPGTSGMNSPVPLATDTSKNLWLLYNNPWGINSGSGTMTQTYSGSGSLTTAINLTGLPGGGVDAYPFVLYGCDPWMDCYQNQPPQFPKQLSAMSSLMVDIKYAMTGTITGSDIDMLFDEWVCTSASPSDSSQCLEVEVLPYYSFVYFGGGTFIKTINEPVILNGVSTTFSFDEYVGGSNVLFYPHSMPGLSAGEISFNILDLLKAGVTAFGNSSYQYVAGIELGTEFGASSTQNYTLTLNKLEIDQTVGSQPAAPTNLTSTVVP